MGKAELVSLICRIYKISKDCKAMLEVEFCGNETEEQLFVKKINEFPNDSYYVKNKKRVDDIHHDAKYIGWGYNDSIYDVNMVFVHIPL